MTDRIQGFSSSTFSARREKVFQRLEGGAMVLSSAPLLFRSRDTEHRYRPDSELFYLTGCTQPGVVALLRGTPDGGHFLLFVASRDLKAEVWTGRKMGPEKARKVFGADECFPLERLEEELPKRLKEPKDLYFRLGQDPDLERLVVGALGTARKRGARKGEGPRGVTDPGEILDDLRLRKGPEEVSRIRQATSLTAAAFRDAIKGTRPGMGEWEVESLLEAGFRGGGAQGPAFPTIVGSGGNACTLHYSANEHTIDAGELVLLDGGAEVGLYSGDVTRTFPADGRFSRAQRDVYEVVLSAHQAALGAVRPGTPVGDVHSAALEALTRGLIDLGILSGQLEELLEAKAFEPYFPHQTSHWLGLDVHDVGDYARDGKSRVLEPGMVLTVEPGLYFPASEDEEPGPHTGIGVRIEDDLLVTEEGSENLTRELPVSPDEVEEMLVGS